MTGRPSIDEPVRRYSVVGIVTSRVCVNCEGKRKGVLVTRSFTSAWTHSPSHQPVKKSYSEKFTEEKNKYSTTVRVYFL